MVNCLFYLRTSFLVEQRFNSNQKTLIYNPESSFKFLLT
nr:MAG TPA: hypothetical protein [Bacteriophage sp.]